ncbi:MAG: hypothetical protein LBQ75_02400 [Zoogloeaceae bacterium]|jgi:hypothetical protein|nr:hypothetical protein [Zoogloeaceae bacterium]
MLTPIKIAFGEYMGRFYRSLVPTNAITQEFCERGLAKAIAWAPARMVDSAYEMLQAWQRNDTDSAPTRPPKIPVILVGMARDWLPTGRDFTRQVAEPVKVEIPGDEKGRVFGLKTMAGDIRAQVAFFAHEESTARALAAQLLLFVDGVENRRFNALYEFAGQKLPFPCSLEDPGAPGMLQQVDEKNLTILAVDLTLKATIPIFDAPRPGEENDGLGIPGTDDPAGYPRVSGIDMNSKEAGGN